MSDLDALRKEIDEIDSSLSDLLKKRFSVSEQVALHKLEEGGPIFRPDREKEILDAAEKALPKTPLLARSFYRHLMRLSRINQYETLINAGRLPHCFDAIRSLQPCTRLAHFGASFSWSYLAAKELYPEASLSACSTFSEVFEAVTSGKCEGGIIPLDNSTAGEVSEVYDLLIQNDLYITHSIFLPIRYVLAAKEGTALSDIQFVLSHPQALAQCSSFIKEKGFSPVSASSTSYSAEKVAQEGKNFAALCSAEAAKAYHLTSLLEEVQNAGQNSTRFILVQKHLPPLQGPSICSIAFSLPHESGSLSGVTSLFSDLGISLQKISSRPIPEKPWEYFFYLDFTGSFSDQKTKAALLFLESELPFFRLLGGYPIIN